jgi:hypothetical protein
LRPKIPKHPGKDFRFIASATRQIQDPKIAGGSHDLLKPGITRQEALKLAVEPLHIDCQQ